MITLADANKRVVRIRTLIEFGWLDSATAEVEALRKDALDLVDNTPESISILLAAHHAADLVGLR